MGKAENRRGGLYHLTFLGMARSDDAIGYREQLGVAYLVTRVGLLRSQRRQIPPRTVQAGTCLLVFTEVGVALGQQQLLTLIILLGKVQA